MEKRRKHQGSKNGEEIAGGRDFRRNPSRIGFYSYSHQGGPDILLDTKL